MKLLVVNDIFRGMMKLSSEISRTCKGKEEKSCAKALFVDCVSFLTHFSSPLMHLLKDNSLDQNLISMIPIFAESYSDIYFINRSYSVLFVFRAKISVTRMLLQYFQQKMS